MLGKPRLRALFGAGLVAAIMVTVSPAMPSGPSAAAASPAAEVVAIARSKVGARYAYGMAGPRTFDCSGLVIYAFRHAGFGVKVGNGRYRSASAMYRWFRSRGLASRANPRVGDVVVWGGGQHVGIYIGHGKAISALTNGVRVHGVRAVAATFTAYLHTGLGGVAAPRAKAAATTGAAAKAKAAARAKAAATRRTTVTLNLRSGPGRSYRIVRVLPRRTPLVALGTRRDAVRRIWLHVRVGTRRGWVAASFTRPA